MSSNKYLLLIWKDPITRRNFAIGKLCHGQTFTFEYCGDFDEAENFGWRKLNAFPEEKTYTSENMFPVFSSRLPDRKRRDIEQILKKYSLNIYDEFELLRKSEGRLPIDTYSFIDPIFPSTETVERNFYIMGTRHQAACKGNDCSLLPNISINDYLIFEKEPNNKYDCNAIQVLTQEKELLGYVPRYYNQAILERLNNGMSYSCIVIDINLNGECSECIKVKLNMPAL